MATNLSSPYKELESSFRVYQSILNRRLEERLVDYAEDVVGEAKARLETEDHVFTGNLRDSIHYDVRPYEHGIIFDFIADATADNGAKYAEFIEHGTGIYNNGRQTPWRYFNKRLGQWVTTRGSHPYPFLEPAIKYQTQQHSLRQLITDTIKIDMERLFSKGKYIGGK